MSQAQNSTEYVSVQHVARMLDCSATTVRELIETGELDAFRLRDRGWWKVSKDSVLVLIERRRKRL